MRFSHVINSWLCIILLAAISSVALAQTPDKAAPGQAQAAETVEQAQRSSAAASVSADQSGTVPQSSSAPAAASSTASTAAAPGTGSDGTPQASSVPASRSSAQRSEPASAAPSRSSAASPARSSPKSSSHSTSSVPSVSSAPPPASSTAQKKSSSASSIETVTNTSSSSTSSALLTATETNPEEPPLKKPHSFTDRETWGYSMPIIDPNAIVRVENFSFSATNLLLALLCTLIAGVSGVMVKRLMIIDPLRVRRILGRVPLQAFATLVIVWLLHLLIPSAGAQGFSVGSSGPVTWTVVLYAFTFFLVVGTSNYLFNNMLASDIGDRIQERITGSLGRFSGNISDRNRGRLLVIILIALYGVIGAYINSSFNLLPAAQTGMALVAILTVVVSTYAKDTVRYLLTRRFHWEAWFKANILGMILAVACVAISRSLELSPGYIYGIPAGLFIASALYKEREGYFESLALAWVIVAAVFIWLIRYTFEDNEVVFDLLNLLFVILAEDAFLELLPLPGLGGGTIFTWKPAVWAPLFAAVTFLLFQTMFNPQGTIASLEQSPPAQATLLLFGCYFVGVCMLWAVVSFRRRRYLTS